MYSVKNFRHQFSFLFALALVLTVGLACNFDVGENEPSNAPLSERRGEKKPSAADDAPRKLESYTVKGFKFSYYLIPVGLNREELIATAQQLHDAEPDAQLILVDDDSKLADYINYAKQFSKGETGGEFPKQWAEAHIVANVQKYLSGKYKLCEGYGSIEIAELE